MGKPTERCIKLEDDVGPAYCGECSGIIEDYVPWDGHTEREAKLLQSLEPYLETGFRWNPKD